MTDLSFANPREIGLNPDRLATARQLLDSWTSGPAAPLPGAAFLVGRRGQAVEPQFFGKQGPESDAGPLRRDSAFLLASITKPFTYLAAMLLIERGELSLGDRVVRYIPEFAAHHKDGTLVLHLCTHTSGLPDMLENNVELRRQHAPLAKFVEHTARDVVPKFAPGTGLNYQSMGTLMVAEIVERITGQPLPDFLQQEVFGPLSMDSSALGARALDRERLARVRVPEYLQGGDYGWNGEYWRTLGAPWGGMFGTPADLARLCLCLLGGGRAGGRQLISPAALARMTSNRLHDFPDLPEPIRRAQPWGLGWRLNHPGTPDSWGDLLGPRVYGHVGATGTMMWIDPDADAFFILLTTGPLDDNLWRFVRISNVVASAFTD